MQWTIDPTHSQVSFAVRHLGISTVRGSFGAVTGTISEADGVISAVEANVDVAAITTGNEQRDEHLRSTDFFDVATHPAARFQLASAVRKGDTLTVSGKLSLRGVTKAVELTGVVGGPAVDPWGNTKVSAELSTKISRKEWGLTWNAALEAGGVLVGDEVTLQLEVQAAPTSLDG